MNQINSTRQQLSKRIFAVLLTMLAVLVVSFCAAVMAIIYKHADENGMVPGVFSLSNQITQPTITILPPEQPYPSELNNKAPKYYI